MANHVGRQRCKVSDAFIEMYRRDAFEHIALFYNPRRTHTKDRMLSPIAFEECQLKLENADVEETSETSLSALLNQE